MFLMQYCHTKAEAKFLENMDKRGISTLLLDYNQKLFLTDKEKTDLEKELNQILDKHSINKNNVYIGGFSSGGNIAILLGNDLIKTKNKLQPKGVFVVDSPLDLENLYQDAQKDIQEKSNNDAVEECHFIINMFDKNLGKPVYSIQNYAYYSPYLISKNTVENLKYLKNIKVRFYCEPDLEWQIENRNRTYEDLNAFKLEKTSDALKELGSKKMELIKTKNRGFRANGDKNPHTWNLVEHENLINWMLN